MAQLLHDLALEDQCFQNTLKTTPTPALCHINHFLLQNQSYDTKITFHLSHYGYSYHYLHIFFARAAKLVCQSILKVVGHQTCRD